MAAKSVQTGNQTAPRKPVKPAFTLLTREQMKAEPELEWVIDDIIPERSVNLIYGGSGCGKTFFALAMCYAVAYGWPTFMGKAVNAKRPVVYICLEGKAGMNKRQDALDKWAMDNGLPLDGNLFTVKDSFSLIDAKNGIETFVASSGLKPEQHPFVVVDTLSKATLGYSTDSNDDMNLAIDKAMLLGEMLQGEVSILHHVGAHGNGKDPRGATCLIDAPDTLIRIERKGDKRQWYVRKSKDGEDGYGGRFDLATIDLGLSKKGKPISSMVAVSSDDIADFTVNATDLNGNTGDAFKTLQEIATEHPEGVTYTEWVKVYAEKHPSVTWNSAKSAVQRARDDLLEANLIAKNGRHFLPA